MKIKFFFLTIISYFLIQASSWAIPVDYEKAFALDKIHLKYASLLNRMGCYKNIFEEKFEEKLVENEIQIYQYSPLQSNYYEHIVNIAEKNTEFESYQKECLDHLHKYKNRAVLHPALTNGASLFLISCMTAVTIAAMPSNWSFDVMYLSFYSVFLLKEIMPSLFNYFLPNSQILDEYEIAFVKNQCFIPKPLWRPLMTQFKLAAQNLSTQDVHLKFIKFALGLKVYHPKEKPEEGSFKDTIKKLIVMLDNYFSKYEDVLEQEMNILGGRIAHYIAQLYGTNPSITCVHLMGAPGLGKTNFATDLEKWFKENLPKNIYCQRALFLNKNDIEGNEKETGAFLKAYRDAQSKNANGLFLFCDEISLNHHDIINSFKRVFNGNQSQIPVRYFTENGADDFSLPLIPILAIFANNDSLSSFQQNNSIDDNNAAILNRVQQIDFPRPKQEYLKEFALHCIKLQKLSELIPNLFENDVLRDDYNKELEDALKDKENFRDVEKIIEALLFKWVKNSLSDEF